MVSTIPAAREIARLIANNPTPAAVIAFQLAPATVERAYGLVEAERERDLTSEERRELDTYLALQHMMILAKAEARRVLRDQAS